MKYFSQLPFCVNLYICLFKLLFLCCNFHLFVFVIKLLPLEHFSRVIQRVCVCVFLCAHTLETNEPSESFCSSSDATQWFKEANGADSLAARKVKITILLLKTVYIVAVQVLLSVPAPWLSAESQAPDVKAGSPPPATSVVVFGGCLLRRIQVYCLRDIL